jgi:hypothetical protein
MFVACHSSKKISLARSSARSTKYLRGTRLEVGLLLFFGPKPSFFRLLFTNDRKQHVPGLDRIVQRSLDRS